VEDLLAALRRSTRSRTRSARRTSSSRTFSERRPAAWNAAGLVAHCEIRPGHAAQALPHYAMEVGAELLVIGHSGHSGIWGRLLGTTADKVVEHAPCSVLVVR